MLRDNIKKIFSDYLASRNENFADHPLASVLRRDFPNYLKNLTDQPQKYKFAGSAGQGNWTYSPWVAVFNKKITKSAQNGYYIVYLFREDMKGVYLSLNQGMTDIRNQTSNNGETKRILRSKASEFRTQLKDHLFSELLENIDLRVENSPNAPFYEAGNIYAKYYSADDLPSEDILEADYKEILSLYELLVGGSPILKVIEDAQEIKAAQVKFLDILYRNSDEIIPTGHVKIGLSNETGIKTYWSNDLGFWVVNRELDIGNRFFNAFGTEKPNDNSEVSAICEINIEKYGLNRKTSGAFAKDTKGNVYLIDRGNLGGIAKKDFLDHYNGASEIVQDGDQKSRVIVLGELADVKLPELVRDFILEVANIKKILTKADKLVIIEDPVEIKDAQNIFLNKLYSNADKIISTNKIGFPGGKLHGKAHWSNKLGFWVVNREPASGTRYWNGFGIKEPSEGSGLTITAEINFPIEGIDRRIAGAFVTDGNEIYVVHRGKLGGNYSKKFFDENYSGEWTTIQDGEKQSNVVLIGSLNDPKLPEKVSDFVFEVDRMKTGRTKPILPPKQSFTDYLKEHGYLFSPEIIENILLSLKVKPFVILTGNSGTGKTKLAQLFAQHLMKKERSDEKSITTKVKPNLSSIKYSAWTLDRSDLEPLHLDLEKNFDIKVDNLPAKAKLSMSPRLWYEDPDKKIKTMLEKLANKDPEKEIELKLITKITHESKYQIVPVGANWTENRHLLGFHNVINGNYQSTQALNLILEASQDKISPYFMILDEMNLSHVERYFSDFLSAMESGEPINLHNNDHLEIPQELDIPLNLLVLGTVNVDETTYMFSPKVLDRANTIEFSTYPAKDYMLDNQEIDTHLGDINYLENPLSDVETRNFTIDDLKENLKNVKINSDDYLWDILAYEINYFQETLGKAGFDFGFRVINEILRFMYVSWVYEGRKEIWDNWMRYFDAQIKQKMLPKLHGSQRVLEEVLRELFELCYMEAVDSAPRYFDNLDSDPSVKYLSSALKIQEMDKVLNEQRYVSFIN